MAAGETIVTAWSGIGDPAIAGILAAAGYPAVTLDMQHGLHDVRSVERGVAAIAAYGAPAIVRVPVGDFAMVSRALDFGASAVIAPMINSAADARAFVSAAKYPPLGDRSWGPPWALAVHRMETPAAYLDRANDLVLTFAMIETPAALAALDDILAVKGIDGVFLGPSDMSITLTNGAGLAPKGEAVRSAMQTIADKARAAGCFAGAFAVDVEAARELRDAGYRFLALGFDHAMLAGGAKTTLAAFGA